MATTQQAVYDAVVGDKTHRPAVEMREAADQRLAIARLERIEARAVDDPRDDLGRVPRVSRVGGDEAQEVAGIMGGRFDAMVALRSHYNDRSPQSGYCVRGQSRPKRDFYKESASFRHSIPMTTNQLQRI